MNLHLIPNSHIDPVWLWDKYEGIDEVLNTFRTACDLLDEFPALTFTASSLQFYDWVRRLDPPLFKRVCGLVAADRWEVAGGWWVEADSNLPGAASFRKHAELSQAFARTYFRRPLDVAYLPDSFGHPATLPAILAAAGFKYFLFCRPGAHEKADLPDNLFHWEYNGSRVLAYRVKHHYLQYGSPAPDKVDPAHLLPRLNDPEHARRPASAFLFGVGDHGGGPARAEILFYNDYIRSRPDGQAGYSSCRRFFGEAAASPDIPLYRGDLHMHAIGCYSVMRHLKQAVREAEEGLAHAERAAAMAGRTPDLTDAWKTTLFNEFHDILPGSAAPHAVDQALAEMGGVEQAWRETAYDALKSLSRQAPVACREGEFRLFNTLPFEVRRPIALEAFPFFKPGAVLRDGNGTVIPHQQTLPSVRCANRRWEFVDTLPARGFKAYRFTGAAAPGPAAPAPFAPGDRIASDRGRITASGGMILLGNGAERPLLEKPVRFLVLNDDSDTWGHGKRVYADVAGSFALESSAVSEGPVVSKLFQRFAWGHSRLEVIHSLYAGLPEVRIELVVYWAEHRKILKMEMLPGGRSPVIHMQAPGGWVERRTDGAELPLHHALLVPGTEPPFGLVQTGAFACDCDGGRLRITLVRSSLYGYDQGQKLNPADPQRETDQGEHRFRLCLLSRPGLSAESLDREALAFTEPFPVIRESGASG